MEERIIIAGFGGQGVVTTGRILGEAFSLFEGKNAVVTQSYGPESRGGACRSEVVISDGRINYPNVRKADVFVALSQVALDTYCGGLKEGGILLVDPKAVKNIPDRDRYTVYEVPTMEIAHTVGTVKFQNTVALGALYLLIKEHLNEEALRKAIVESVPQDTLEDNMKAFDIGLDHMRAHYAAK